MPEADELLLIDRYLNGTASAPESAELERRLSSDPAFAEAFARASRFDGLLSIYARRRAATAVSAPFAAAKSAPRTGPIPQGQAGVVRGRFVRYAASLAAVFLLAAGVALFVRPRGGEALGNVVLAGQVLADGAPATRIADGASVQVVGDTIAVIRLSDGSRVELSPAGEAVVVGRAEGEGTVIELKWGRGRFRVEPGAAGKFRVRTPMGTVTAPEAEFTVELHPADLEGVEDMSIDTVKAFVVAVAAGSVLVDFGGAQHPLGLGQNRAFGQDKPKGPASLPSGDLFFTGKSDSPWAMEKQFPGVVGAMMLTDEQKQKLAEALAATIGREDLRNAARGLKSDPNITEAQREAYQKMMREAREQLAQKIAAVLNAEQKALVTRLQTAAEESLSAAKEALAGEAPGKGGDKAELDAFNAKVRTRAGEEFERKLNGFLTPDQFEAYKKAAEAQKNAGKGGGNKVKTDAPAPVKVK
jgi:ferric-dicitrate binding protein FerR (iron transport regulator)